MDGLTVAQTEYDRELKARRDAEAEATRLRAAADAAVLDQFAREMELRRTEVSRVRAFGPKAVFVPTEGLGAQMGSSMAAGMAAGFGAAQAAEPKVRA